MLTRRSDTDIIKFITELPHGNVPQYAKLLSTTAIRINALLATKAGQRIVRAGMVVGPEKGKMPAWANGNTKRGALRANDVDAMRRNNLLPPFIQKLLTDVHPKFQDDALNFFREALDQTANHLSIEAQMKAYMDQDRHRTDKIVEGEDRIVQLEGIMLRYERIIDQADRMAGLIENRTTASDAAALPEAEPA